MTTFQIVKWYTGVGCRRVAWRAGWFSWLLPPGGGGGGGTDEAGKNLDEEGFQGGSAGAHYADVDLEAGPDGDVDSTN
jgi:hypothetical protein